MEHARAVIIGGGVGGTSIAYHLAELGWTDIVLVDRAELTSGLDVPLRRSRRPAPRVGDPDPDDDVRRRALPAARGGDRRRPVVARGRLAPAGVHAGAARGADAARPAGPRRSACRWSSSPRREAQERFPLMSTDGVLGGVWLPTDGWLDPSGLAQALAAGARQRGAAIRPHHRVVGIGTDGGRVRTSTVEHRGERLEIATDVVVNAGGMFAPEIGRLVGVTVPIDPDGPPVPLHRGHRRASIRGCRTMRDPDHLVLLPRGGRRAVHGRLRARPGAVVARRHPARLQRQAAGPRLAAVRADHGGRHPPASRRSPTRVSAG